MLENINALGGHRDKKQAFIDANEAKVCLMAKVETFDQLQPPAAPQRELERDQSPGFGLESKRHCDRQPQAQH
jgi:hypothetical protein